MMFPSHETISRSAAIDSEELRRTPRPHRRRHYFTLRFSDSVRYARRFSDRGDEGSAVSLDRGRVVLVLVGRHERNEPACERRRYLGGVGRRRTHAQVWTRGRRSWTSLRLLVALVWRGLSAEERRRSDR